MAVRAAPPAWGCHATGSRGASAWRDLPTLPDGQRVIATEITGNGLLSLRRDGLGDPIFIDLAVDTNSGDGDDFACQPVRPSR